MTSSRNDPIAQRDGREMNRQPDAAWTARLTAPVDEATTRQVLHDRRWEDAAGIAQGWSVGREERGLREMDAAARGIENDRMAELLGCVDAVSEHFGIALAAGNEMALWQALRTDPPPPLRRERVHVELGLRSMSALFGHFLLTTGHDLAAVALRCLGLEPDLHQHMLDRLGTACGPGTEGSDQWPSLTADWCRDLKRVARLSCSPSQLELATQLSAVADQPSWMELDGIRPTAGAPGAPISGAWVDGPDHRRYAWDRPQEDRTPPETLTRVERLLSAKLPGIRTQIDLVIADVVP